MSLPTRRRMSALVSGLTALGFSAQAGVPVVDEFTGILDDMAGEVPAAGIGDRAMTDRDPGLYRAIAAAFEERLSALRRAEAALDAVAALPTGTPGELEIALEAALALKRQVADTVLLVMDEIALDVESPEIRLMLLSALEERTMALETSTSALTRTLESRSKSESCERGG